MTNDDADPNSKVADHWGRLGADQVHRPEIAAETSWADSPLIRSKFINPRMSGSPDVNWLEWTVRNHLPPDTRRACTLGCGSGGLERHARSLGLQAEFDSFDISEQALTVARDEARRLGLQGIHYRCADLNRLELPANHYDVVFGSHSLHHVEQLDGLFRTVRGGLVPGGLLAFDEYVGPRRLQWTELQLELANRVLAWLPEYLREDRVQPGVVKDRILRPSVEEVVAEDPSEAALPDQILPLARKYLEPVLQRDLGGTLAHIVLERIVGNFREDDEEALARLHGLFSLEAQLIEMGVLSSDFVFAIFRFPA